VFVNSISIRREGYFGAGYGRADQSKPFAATIEVEGQRGKVELNLSPDMSARIIALIAGEIADAGRATAEAMVATCLTVVPTPQLEGAK
jgi:hypothetical protein